MELDEAIRHCEEVAEENENEANFGFGNACIDRSSCLECAKEHRQLAAWLRELKAYRDASQQETGCSRKENVPRLSKPAFTVIDHILKEHEEHEDRFTTFCDGRHQQITAKQINAELDKLYNYYYRKGEGSGEGTK